MAALRQNEWSIDPKRLWMRYALALGILFALFVASHLSAIHANRIAASDASVINDAGRQRMLSQNTLYHILRVHDGADIAENTALATQAIDLMEKNHGLLRALAKENQVLYPMYFEDGQSPSLDTMLEGFIADARLAIDPANPESAGALERLTAIGPKPLLTLLDAAVMQHERQANANSQILQTIHFVALCLALVTLLCEAMLIFRPAHFVTCRTLEALENKSGALETAQREVSRRNRQLAAMCDVAEHDALHDALTGLANRRYLQRELVQRCEEIGQTEGALAMLHIDLDRFKEINDALGHAAGDQILVHISDVLRGCLRDVDFIARISGDEFVVLTNECEDHEALQMMANRMIGALSQPLEYEGAPYSFSATLSVQIGIEYRHGPDLDADLILSNADIALYRAKEKGRNCFEFFTEAMRLEVEESRALGDDLLRALERDEFFPVYQVQVTSNTREVHGVEALARWQHPEKGELAPWRFLPVAARLGVTDSIDDAILRQALVDLKAWQEAGINVSNLSVNVSSGRLTDPTLIPRLREMDIPSGMVSFEVLESIFADKIDDDLRYILDELDEMGIAIEVDDFGTGHASLLALLSLRPHRLKIARELIDPAPDSVEHRAVLESIMQIAETLNTGVVAEGIETEAHALLSEEIGVHVLQGYHFCRPLPANAAATCMIELAAAAKPPKDDEQAA